MAIATLEPIKLGIGIGAGVVDDQMEAWDVRRKRTKSFQNATDLTRVGAVAVGLGLQAFMPRYSKLGDNLATSFLPLLTKSVVRTIRGAMKSDGGTGTFIRRRVGNAGLGKETSRTYEPEAEQAGVF